MASRAIHTERRVSVRLVQGGACSQSEMETAAPMLHTRSDVPAQKIPSYKPSVFYFRQAIEESESHEEAKQIARHAVSELEFLKGWVRSLGLTPPKKFILSSEAEDKGLPLD